MITSKKEIEAMSYRMTGGLLVVGQLLAKAAMWFGGPASSRWKPARKEFSSHGCGMAQPVQSEPGYELGEQDPSRTDWDVFMGHGSHSGFILSTVGIQ